MQIVLQYQCHISQSHTSQWYKIKESHLSITVINKLQKMKYVVIIAATLTITFAQNDETTDYTTSFPNQETSESENDSLTSPIIDIPQENVEENLTESLPESSRESEDSFPNPQVQSENNESDVPEEQVDESAENTAPADITTQERQETPTESSNLDFSLESTKLGNQLSLQPSLEPSIEAESAPLSQPKESYVETDSVTEAQLDSDQPQKSLELEPSLSSDSDSETSEELITEQESSALSEPSSEIITESTEEQNPPEESLEVDQSSTSTPANDENEPKNNILLNSFKTINSAEQETTEPSAENLEESNEASIVSGNPKVSERFSQDTKSSDESVSSRSQPKIKQASETDKNTRDTAVPQSRSVQIPAAKSTQPTFAQRTPFAWKNPTRVTSTTTRTFTLQPRPITSTSRPYTPFASNVSSEDRNAKTLYYESEMNPNGTYRYAFETSNGISSEAEGSLRAFEGKPPKTDIVVSGAFSWIYPNGNKVSVKYTADENGYHPESDVLPTSPPVPPQIARALEWLRRVNDEKDSKQSRR